MATMVENESCKSVTPADDNNPRILYEHQIDAMKALDKMDKKNFRTLVVLPTGGGKTLTAVYWLLKKAVDNNKKVLWIAHRHLLLDQAAEAFRNNAYTDTMINKTKFTYRIISGNQKHDNPVNIKKSDNILIMGKDSLVRSLNMLDEWLDDEDVYFVIDEAHHAVARSYRTIIDYVYQTAKSVKLLGLTATPFRTSKDEEGALKKIFTDDIAYKIDLEELIKRQILATPIPQSFPTNIDMGSNLGVRDMQTIIKLDELPKNIQEELAQSKERNSLIVNEYIKNRDKYGATIVFAVNVNQAITISKLFNDKGVKSAYIVSTIYDMDTNVKISDKDNAENIEKYKNGELDVLVNVNILTEGTDLPKTHTVFLTRPTISTALMTQMVGRALRGPEAGGTADAHIVSFVDNWKDKIAWITPEALFDEEYEFNDSKNSYTHRAHNFISIKLIEMFAKMADRTVDTSFIDSVSSIETLPLGMYILSTDDFNHTILVYDSTQEAYNNLFRDLKNIFAEYGIDGEEISAETLDEMVEECTANYFAEDELPFMFSKTDIKYLLMYYAQKPYIPDLIPLDRKSVNIEDVAKYIHDKDMRESEKNAFIRNTWEDESNTYKAWYSNYEFFHNLIDTELRKLANISPTRHLKPQTDSEMRDISHNTLQWIIENFPQYGLELRDGAYAKARTDDGRYICAKCGQVFNTRKFLQVDHIKPMSKGGLTVPENLQVLCRKCNGKKGDKQ